MTSNTLLGLQCFHSYLFAFRLMNSLDDLASTVVVNEGDQFISISSEIALLVEVLSTIGWSKPVSI